MVAHTVLVGAGLVSFFLSPAAEADEGAGDRVRGHDCRVGFGLGLARGRERLRAVCGLAGGVVFLLLSPEGPCWLGRAAGRAAAAAEEEEGERGRQVRLGTVHAGAARCRMDQFGSAIVIVLQQSRNSQVSPVGERLGQYAGGDGVNRGSGLARL